MQKKFVSFPSPILCGPRFNLDTRYPIFTKLGMGICDLEGAQFSYELTDLCGIWCGHNTAEGTCYSLNSIQSVLTIRHANL